MATAVSLRRALQQGALLLATLVLLGAEAAAFDRTDKHPEHGFSVSRPSSFEARPVPPGDDELLIVYAPKDAPQDRRAPVTHNVYRVEALSTAAEVQRWVLRNFQPSELESERSVRKRYGRSPARFTGSFFDDEGKPRSLFVHAWMGPEEAIVFVGECEPKIERRETRVFNRAATSFRFFTQAEMDEQRAKWARRYRRTRLPHIEERIEVASALVEGWAVRDTEHSIVLYHGPSDGPVLEQIAQDLVAVRKRFERDFPPDRPTETLSVVRVCRDRGEYLTFGGNPATVGHFNPNTKELVLYDAREVREGPMPAGHQTMRTLYHEACHQFVHHTASALSPHSWYDEGTAEFYAGSVLERGRVVEIAGLTDRERYLRSQLVTGELPPLEGLLRMTQEQFYADANVNYSMGYAFVRFLRTSSAAQRTRGWSDFLERYFEELRTRWRLEAEGLALSGLSGPKYFAAIERSRGRALEAALEGVELDELEAAFLEWVRTGE